MQLAKLLYEAQQHTSEHACSYREEEIIEIFERNTNSVANVFDITLQVFP